MRFILLISLLVSFASNAATYYVSPSGSDSNPGTIGSPFATFNKLSTILVAGDIAYIRGGTYTLGLQTLSGLNGSSGNMISIHAYQSSPGVYESPVLDFGHLSAGSNWAFTMDGCDYVHIKKLRITDFFGGVPAGFVMENSPNNIIEWVEVDNIGGYGFKFENGASNNLILNCDAHHLADPSWDNANGFNTTGGVNAANNTFENCRAWWISDDGWDFFEANGFATMKNCWSFWNGFEPGTFTPRGDGQGFKLGPDEGYPGHVANLSTVLTRVLNNCLAFENLNNGFDQNVGRLLVHMYNCTAYDNGATGFRWGYFTAILQQFKNNISYRNTTSHQGTEITGTNNTWNGAVTVTNGDFLSVSSVGMDGPRGPNGELPVLNFLKLAPGSDLIDAGVNVGLPFNGTAPDMGSFETGAISGATGNFKLRRKRFRVL